MALGLRFIGVGDAAQQNLGHASACVEIDESRLLIDLGPGVFDSFLNHYDRLPDAVFITHCHLDHIADFERLFIRCWFAKHKPLVFAPASIVSLLNERVGTYPNALAEGGVNFWEAFQLIPVAQSFEFKGHRFEVLPARHHGYNTAFSLHLPDAFYYTGDTRPIPEVLQHHISSSTIIFHDCSVIGNPSHSGIDDLQREYTSEVLDRLWVYHYNSASEKQTFERVGLRCVEVGARFDFS